MNCRVNIWILVGGEDSFRKVKSFHLLDKKHTNVSQFFWLNDSVVTGWLVWGMTIWDMLSLFCDEILLSEDFSNFFIAKSKTEFPADIEVLLSLAVRNFIVLNELSSLLEFVFRSAYSSPAWVRGTLESWEFMSVQFYWPNSQCCLISCIFLHVSFHAENCPVSFLHSSDT